MMLIFVLAKTSANDFNKSREGKALHATNWWGDRNSSSDQCTWPGISCIEGRVISIYFYCYDNEGLGDLGSLDFASFPNLEKLSIYNCKLKGSISEQIGLLSNLTHLLLYNNHLTELNLSHNNFNVFIPSQLVRLKNLVTVDFSQNQLMGSIPSYLDSMANLTNLTDLSFRGNLLTGKLPVWLTNLTQLINLDLSQNNFTDLIPPSFGSMVNLNVLDLSDNNLDGPIPSSFGNLSQLQILNLAMNCIDSPIPLDIVYLMNLRHLDLHHNRLGGLIHPELEKLSRLYYLDLSSNQLSGNISLANPCLLSNLNLSKNLMMGAVTSVRDCRYLEYLDISGNRFVGEALNHCDFPELLLLNQSQNHLTGEMVRSSSNLRSEKSTCNEHKRRIQHVPDLPVFLPIILGLCFSVVAYFFCVRKKATTSKIKPEITKHGDVCTIMNYDGTIAYEDFIAATEDFDLKYCIGTGGYGSVYEAKLPSGQTFALKKLHR
ncbi:kinase RLK-Pelle-LRR-XI-1 family protein, partial [Tanacetum coccineum]